MNITINIYNFKYDHNMNSLNELNEDPKLLSDKERSRKSKMQRCREYYHKNRERILKQKKGQRDKQKEKKKQISIFVDK